MFCFITYNYTIPITYIEMGNRKEKKKAKSKKTLNNNYTMITKASKRVFLLHVLYKHQ